MYNSDTPQRAELPSSRQLARSTILAAVSALLILIAVVLPAEYGIDPTGVGRVLRLTDMGETKRKLAAEAAADSANAVGSAQQSASDTVPVRAAIASPPQEVAPAAAIAAASAASAVPLAAAKWRDTMPVTLAPGMGSEIKLKMAQGAKAQYAWAVEGGAVNFDTHGDAPGKSISYEKGRGVAADEGELVAAFTGNHGWYWRNRGKSSVTVTLRARGDYTEMQQMK